MQNILEIFTFWASSIAALGVIAVVLWRWSGTALPPASVVDKKFIGKQVREPPHVEGDSEHGAEHEGHFVIASEIAYNRVPVFETVTVRAFVVEGAIAILFALVLVKSGAAILDWFRAGVAAYPIVSAGIAALCFVVALFFGAIRQLFGYLLSHAGALPAVDDQGRPKFAYLGDVPPLEWQYSPWYRAVTWLVVSTASLLAALIGSLIADQLLEGAFIPALVAILVLRWLISSIPWRLAQRHQLSDMVEPPQTGV